MGIVGPWLDMRGGNALALTALLFNRVLSHHFLRVGLCPTRLTFCRRRGRAVGVGFHQDGGDRVDPRPRDHQSSMCANVGLSELDRGILLRHVASSDGCDLHHDFHRSDGWRWNFLMMADRVNLDRPLT